MATFVVLTVVRAGSYDETSRNSGKSQGNSSIARRVGRKARKDGSITRQKEIDARPEDTKRAPRGEIEAVSSLTYIYYQ